LDTVWSYSTAFIFMSLVRVLLAFGLLFFALPLLLFDHDSKWGMVDVFFSNLMKMCLITIAFGYFLVATRLYEIISLITVYVLFFVVRVRRQTPAAVIKERFTELSRAIFDVLERRAGVMAIIRALHLPRIRMITPSGSTIDAWEWITASAAMLVFLFSAYLRYWDGLKNAAIPMADAYVTLAWEKYIESRILFHDGLYPQGFVIVMSAVRKVASIDPALVLKFVGPLNSVLIVVSIYYFVSRACSSSIAGLSSAFIYGVLPSLLPLEWARQASTNSQEFGLLFLLPTGWFALNYLMTGEHQDFLSAVSGVGVIGFVHPVAAFFLVLVLIATYAAGIVSGVFDLKRYTRLTISGGVAAVAAVVPLAYGLLRGVTLHESSAEFATMTAELVAPPIKPILWIALASSIIGVIWLFLRGKKYRPGALLSFFLVIGGLLLYQAPRFGVKNVALASRSPEFTALGAAIGVGMGVSLLTARDEWPAWRKTASVLALCGVMLVSGSLWHAAPADAYTMQSNAQIEEYFRIEETMPTSDWMIVSNEEGYALAYGVGWHMMTDDLLKYYDPWQQVLVAKDGPNKGQALKTPYIFIYQEKNIYDPGIPEPLIKKRLQDREKQKPLLADWIETYRSTHTNIKVYYEDKDFMIWLIEQPRDKEEMFRQIWGT
jgi:hypothetical protein